MENSIENKKIQSAIKRIFDIIFSLIFIIVLSPILIILAVLIKISSEGPAIFKQIRVGKGGKNFKIYKFRTMRPSAEKEQKLKVDKDSIKNFVFQSENDTRITNIGSFLRKTSLDELPQLFNVFTGNMSIIGPRPEIPDIVKLYPEEYKKRLLVLPGITGLAQVSGRGEIELGKTVAFDVEYIDKFSLLLDLKILFKTIAVVFKREGAR